MPDMPDMPAEEAEKETRTDIQIPLNFIQRWTQNTETYLRSKIHLQNLWVLSHLVTILGSSLYIFALFDGSGSQLQSHSYKLAALSTTLTFVIVMYRANFEEQLIVNDEKEEVIVKPKVMSVSELMQNENALLFGYVLLWDFTAESIIKLIPFVIYSMINISGFFIQELIPDSQLSKALFPLFNYLELPLLITASHFDMIVMLQLANEAYDTRNAYPLVIYIWIWCLRFENSEISRSSMKAIVTFVDDLMCLSIVPTKLSDQYVEWRRRWTFMIPMEMELTNDD